MWCPKPPKIFGSCALESSNRVCIPNCVMQVSLSQHRTGGKPVGFKDCTFHRIIKDFMIQVAINSWDNIVFVTATYDFDFLHLGWWLYSRRRHWQHMWDSSDVFSYAAFFALFRSLFCAVLFLVHRASPVHQAFTEINSTMKTFLYPTRLLVFCLWPIADRTLMAVSFSSRARKQTGDSQLLCSVLFWLCVFTHDSFHQARQQARCFRQGYWRNADG